MTGNLENISFRARGQSARQVLAGRMIDDLREDAGFIADDMAALSQKIHVIARLNELFAIAFFFCIPLLFLLQPLIAFIILGGVLIARGLLHSNIDSMRSEHELMASRCREKLVGADNAQKWLDAVIRSN